MLGILPSFIVAEAAAEASAAMPSSPILVPSVVLALCVFAGVGTLMLLPTRRDVSFRRIGGTMVVSALLIFVAILLRNAAAGMNAYFWISRLSPSPVPFVSSRILGQFIRPFILC